MRMPLRLGAFLLGLLWSWPAWAVYGQENPRLEHLYERFMSPCCWQQNLTLHDSPIADELRASIQTMVKSGRSDDEIKDAIVSQYGTRILSLPEGPARGWLFLTPWATAGVALLALVTFVRRIRQPQVQTANGLAPAALEEGWDEL